MTAMELLTSTGRTPGRANCHYLINIWEFVYFLCGLSPPKRRVVRRQNLARRRVTTMCRTSAGIMSIGVVVTKNDIFQKIQYLHVGLQGSVGWLAGCSQGKPWPKSVLLIALLLIAQAACGAAGWLAGCAQGLYSDLASVSLSDWP